MSWEGWNAGLTPGPAQWVKDPALPQLQLGSDPWPGNSMCHVHGAAKKRKSPSDLSMTPSLQSTALQL